MRLRARLRHLGPALGTIAGHAVRAARLLPGLGGTAAIAIGLGQIYTPLAWLAAGTALLLLDWRLR